MASNGARARRTTQIINTPVTTMAPSPSMISSFRNRPCACEIASVSA